MYPPKKKEKKNSFLEQARIFLNINKQKHQVKATIKQDNNKTKIKNRNYQFDSSVHGMQECGRGSNELVNGTGSGS